MNSTIQESTTVGTPRIRLRLDANECADASFGRSSTSIGTYPTTAALEEAIAVRWRTQPDRIVVTAGADDAIDRICTAFLGSGSRVVVTDPTFCMIRRSCARRTTDILSVPWLDGEFPVDAFIDSSRGCDLMVLVTPNNPTGSTIAYDDIERVRNENPDPILMVDLAYLEFATPGSNFGREEIVRRLRRMPRTVMVRTLSKAWGLAGLRVGWAETSPDLARLVRDAGGPFPVSSPSIAMATDVVCDPASDSIVGGRVRAVAENRDSIERALRGQEFDPGTSSANFVLVQDSERMGRVDHLSEGLESLGISVRRFDERSIRDRIRITVPTDPEHTRRLCSCIDAIVDPDGLIFDLDGVLADVDGSYREAIRRTAADFGVRIDDEDVDRVKDIGFANDDWEVTRRILGDRGVVVEYDEVVRIFQGWYLGDRDRPGLRELERPLLDPESIRRASGGRGIGVVTGRPREEALWFLERFGFDSLVDTVVAREDAELKPDPGGISRAMRELGAASAWFLGDTVDDVTAARREPTGLVVPIGVASDGSGSSLMRAGASTVVPRTGGAIDLMRGVLS